MKQVLNINLGGETITIHVDAYNYLCAYLDTIEKPIKNVQVAESVLSDYENRMAKLLLREKESNSIVNMVDIKNAIETLGSPEIPISALYSDDIVLEKRAKTSRRRLYRDRDNKIVGGVASGIAAYFGVHDPIWVRIGFVLMMVAGFASIPLYLVLWIAMPYANTSAERNAMNGETLDLSNTADRVAIRLDNLSNSIRGKFGSSASF